MVAKEFTLTYDRETHRLIRNSFIQLRMASQPTWCEEYLPQWWLGGRSIHDLTKEVI